MEILKRKFKLDIQRYVSGCSNNLGQFASKSGSFIQIINWENF